MPRRVLLVLLAVSTLATALAVVHVRHQHRQEFTRLYELQVERDQLNERWRQLVLEQGTWASHPMVEKKARQRLSMRTPVPEQTVLIRVATESEQ